MTGDQSLDRASDTETPLNFTDLSQLAAVLNASRLFFSNSNMLLVSDIHCGSHEESALSYLVAAARADDDRLVIVSGDLTQDSRTEEFDRMAALITELMAAGITVICTPGNHDFGSQLLNFKLHLHKLSNNYDEAAARLARLVQPTLTQSGVVASSGYDSVFRVGSDVFVALNTQHRKAARVKKTQIAWAAATLADLLRLEAGDAVQGAERATALGIRFHLICHHSMWQDSAVDKHKPMSRRTRLETQLLQRFGFFSYIHGHNHRFTYQDTTTPKTAYRIRRVSAPTLSTRNKHHERGFLQWTLTDIASNAPPHLVIVRHNGAIAVAGPADGFDELDDERGNEVVPLGAAPAAAGVFSIGQEA